MTYCNFKIPILVFMFAFGTANATEIPRVNDVVVGVPNGTFTRVFPVDNIPYLIKTNFSLGDQDANKFNYRGSHNCAGLDAKVDLPIVGTMSNGQSIYKLTDDIGLAVEMGDTNSRKVMSGNNWSNVFNQYCTTQNQGFSVNMYPVVLSRSISGSHKTPLKHVGVIRIRGMNGTVFTGDTEFNVSINPMNIVTPGATCSLQSSQHMTVNLITISKNAIPRSGNEVFAGMANISLKCDPNVTAYATLTDSSTPSNRGDVLTLSSHSTAQGVGLKIYKNGESNALRFGPDSPIKGNENQWLFSNETGRLRSVKLNANYININGNIVPGTVNGVSTITFSYQ